MRAMDVRDERHVDDGQLPADEPLLLGQDTLQDAEHTQDLFGIAFDSTWNLFAMQVLEPEGLAEVRAASVWRHCKKLSRWRASRQDLPLAGRLEEQPLQLRGLVAIGTCGDIVLGVVLVHEVQHDRIGLP